MSMTPEEKDELRNVIKQAVDEGMANARLDLSARLDQQEARRRLNLEEVRHRLSEAESKVEERQRAAREKFEPAPELLAALPPVMRPVLCAFMELRHFTCEGDRFRIRLARMALSSALWPLETDEVPAVMEAAARLEETPVEAITPEFVDSLEPLLFDPSSNTNAGAPLRFDRSVSVIDYLRRGLDEALAAVDSPRSLRADSEAKHMRLSLEVNENAIHAQHRILEAALAIPPDALQALLTSPVEAVRAWARATIDAAEVS
jgi:hypothetical protein